MNGSADFLGRLAARQWHGGGLVPRLLSRFEPEASAELPVMPEVVSRAPHPDRAELSPSAEKAPAAPAVRTEAPVQPAVVADPNDLRAGPARSPTIDTVPRDEPAVVQAVRGEASESAARLVREPSFPPEPRTQPSSGIATSVREVPVFVPVDAPVVVEPALQRQPNLVPRAAPPPRRSAPPAWLTDGWAGVEERAPASTTVHVSIGRLEVRPEVPAPEAKRAAERPKQSAIALDAYLERRHGAAVR